MSKDVRFWRNVTLIGLAHVAVIYGLIRWNRESKSAKTQSIVWMNGGAGEGASSAPRGGSAPKPFKAVTSTPEPSPARTEETEDDRPVLTSAKSDIQLPTPKPSAISTPKATPTPMVKVTPKPTAKPTPKPTPKPRAAGEGARSTRAMSICGNSEVHCDARLRFHGLPVLDVGLEVPLLHRLAGRGGQDARATQNL